ncbi:hypothetical protein EI983_02415 [Roseovarius faecimaris]|uniref:Uncharacterized protein n=1 Tax=Roseovarius faecimaris TaxID=2494550 RepID=A0A6I6IN13_9RHOB|nr:hypothetical protein [Roseovarius faecimaris]QGX97193.1 hypothetical protein EI983_02415 [Roseovarius faecimaris]
MQNGQKIEIPWGGEATLKALQNCFDKGDLLAPLQALKASRDGLAPLPAWAHHTFSDRYAKLLCGKIDGLHDPEQLYLTGLKTSFRQTVRASAYQYVRAWQRLPFLYKWMPRKTIKLWFEDLIQWPGGGYLDALRYAREGLKDTDFEAASQTIRRDRSGRKPPVPWGRWEVEIDLGLRGHESSLFGIESDDVPPHVGAILKMHPQVHPLNHIPGDKSKK